MLLYLLRSEEIDCALNVAFERCLHPKGSPFVICDAVLGHVLDRLAFHIKPSDILRDLLGLL